MGHAYREDLSWIHDLGFGDLARHAAELLLGEFAATGVDGGLVVDLGCGSGIFAKALSDAGYDVLGIDLSPDMIELARQRVPEAEFRCESVLSAELPASVAVAAIGEVFNYRFDASSSRPARQALYRRICQTLQPGGLLLFDAAGPGRVPGDGHLHTCVDGGAWALLMRAEEDKAAGRLTRCITSFRQAGELFRRDDECHELELLPPEQVLEDLAAAGFTTDRVGAYHGYELPAGLHGFLARRRGPDRVEVAPE